MSIFSTKSKNKEKNAKAELYQQYGKKLYGYAISKWKVSEDEAWELIYKTLDKVVQVKDKYQFEDEKKFSGFIFKIFLNYLRNHYRDNKDKHPVTVSFEDDFQVSDDSPENEVEEKISEPMRILQEELTKLKDWQRILLLMRAQEYSYEEISNFVNKPADQLKVYHMRCKKKITQRVNERIDSKIQ